VRHYVPDAVVSSYPNIGENPWEDTRDMSPPNDEAQGGGDGTTNQDHENNLARFKNADVIGHPGGAVFSAFAGQSGTICSGAGTAFMDAHRRGGHHSLNLLGVGANRFGVEANRFGVGANRFGLRANRFGVEANRFGLRANRFGVGANRFGVGASRFGVRANRFGVRANRARSRAGHPRPGPQARGNPRGGPTCPSISGDGPAAWIAAPLRASQ
jgi:hypothetical protein